MKCYEPIRVQYDLLMAKTSPRNKQKWLGYKYGRIAGDIWIFPNDYMAYVIPETEVVVINTQEEILFEFDPNQSTGEQLGGSIFFDDEHDDFFDD